MTATQTAAPHAHEFPCQPPQGDLLAPGDCLVCGKPYALDVAQKRAAEAGLVLVDPEDLRVLMRLAEGYASRDPLRLPPNDSCREALDRLTAAVKA